jgi:predicted metal-binding membrane protein
MVLFVAFGVMNVWVMLGLAAIVVSEKVPRRGVAVGRLAGAAFVLLALLVVASPSIVDALVPNTGTGSNGTMTPM